MSEGPLEGFGIKHMTVALGVVVLLLGWAALANAYHTDVVAGPEFDAPDNVGRRGAGARRFFGQAVKLFVVNAFRHVPDVLAVLKYAFTQRQGLVGFIFLAEAACVAFGLFAGRLEKQLDQPFKPRR